MNSLRSELFKLTSLRSTRLALLFGLMVEGLFAALVPLLTPADKLADLDVASLLSGTALVTLLVPMTGALIVAGEFRHGTAAPTFLAVPRREHVFAAKVLTGILFGIVVGVLFVAINAACALPTLHTRDIAVAGDAAAKTYLGILVGHALSGALGAGIGAVLRNQVAAIAAIAALFLVLGGLAQLIGEPARYSPPIALGALQGIDYSHPTGLDQLSAGLLYGAYTCVLVAAGMVATRCRDILP